MLLQWTGIWDLGVGGRLSEGGNRHGAGGSGSAGRFRCSLVCLLGCLALIDVRCCCAGPCCSSAEWRRRSLMPWCGRLPFVDLCVNVPLPPVARPVCLLPTAPPRFSSPVPVLTCTHSTSWRTGAFGSAARRAARTSGRTGGAGWSRSVHSEQAQALSLTAKSGLLPAHTADANAPLHWIIRTGGRSGQRNWRAEGQHKIAYQRQGCTGTGLRVVGVSEEPLREHAAGGQVPHTAARLAQLWLERPQAARTTRVAHQLWARQRALGDERPAVIRADGREVGIWRCRRSHWHALYSVARSGL